MSALDAPGSFAAEPQREPQRSPDLITQSHRSRGRHSSTVTCRHLASVQPLHEDTLLASDATVTVSAVAAETAARLLATRFASSTACGAAQLTQEVAAASAGDAVRARRYFTLHWRRPSHPAASPCVNTSSEPIQRDACHLSVTDDTRHVTVWAAKRAHCQLILRHGITRSASSCRPPAATVLVTTKACPAPSCIVSWM